MLDQKKYLSLIVVPSSLFNYTRGGVVLRKIA
jgi:hypothetical protein